MTPTVVSVSSAPTKTSTRCALGPQPASFNTDSATTPTRIAGLFAIDLVTPGVANPVGGRIRIADLTSPGDVIRASFTGSANLDLAMERLAAASDDEVTLDASQAPAFLMALTDVRLLLGERMGMRTEEDAERLHAALEVIDDDDPLGYAMAWYDFLTWLQETLTQALMDTD